MSGTNAESKGSGGRDVASWLFWSIFGAVTIGGFIYFIVADSRAQRMVPTNGDDSYYLHQQIQTPLPPGPGMP